MEDKSRDIKEILKRIELKDRGLSARFSDSDVEFEIGKKEEASESSQEPDIAAVQNESSEAVADEPAEESNVSDIFDLAEKEDEETISDDILRIRTTYMPSFTGIGEKYTSLGYVPEDSAKAAAVKPLVLGEENIDPTAEIDSTPSPDAKLVKVNGDAELINGASTLFKFDNRNENEAQKLEKTETESPLEPVEKTAEEPAINNESTASEPSSEPSESTNTEEPYDFCEGAVDIEDPLSKKLPEIYVPKNVSVPENITKVGDELSKEGKSEYTSLAKRDGVKDKFLDIMLSQRIRFLVALALTFALLVFENLYIFGVNLNEVFHFESRIYGLAVIDLQFVICLFVISLPEVVTAFKCALNKRARSEAFIVPSFAVYTAYLISVIVRAPGKYSLFGVLFAIFVLSAIMASYLRTKADFISFKLISRPGDKQIVDNKPTRTLEHENIALDGVVEEYKSKTARVFRTSFVADFFRRTKSAGESLKHLAQLVLIPLGVALVVSVIVYVIESSFLSSMTAFALIFLLSLPAFSILVHKLPHCHASIEAAGENGTLIGENSYFDYSGIDVICFEDTEIFSQEDVNIQRIRLYRSNEDLTKALRQMSALFMNVGGPLDAIFSSSLDKKCEAANGVSIKENGIIGEIDGKKVSCGNYDFMISEGVDIPDGCEGDRKSFDATTVMYAAENGTAYAKFYIRYRFSEEFTMLLPTMREEGIVPLIYTRDPNVSNALMKKLTAGTSTVRVLKKNTTPMRDFAPSKVSAGMLANGDKGSLVNLILLSKRYVKLNSRLKITELSSMLAGLALGVILSLGGMTLIPSAPIALWQLAWCVAVYVISRSFFKLPKKTKDKRKNAK